jgi:outer membrane protein OmpA-like peptidoglycan-associated protein
MGSLASRFLSLALGGRTDAVTQAIARYAGVRESSASSLLSVAAPLVMGLLGDRAKRGGFGAQDLASLLLGERGRILGALPAGLGALCGAETRTVPPVTTRREAPVAAAAGGSRWLWPVLVGLALVAGLWWLLRGAPEPRVAEAPRTTTPLPAVSAPPPIRTVTRDLPGGVRLEVPATGMETRLIGLIQDPSRPLDETTWFEFDRISFETDSARLRPDSRAQLRDLATILRAYPSTQVKIGGYTDATGDPAANVELSRARAESVRSELISQGIDAGRLEAEGYGSAHPVASNDTEEGRAQNRRIALRVTER